MDSAWDVAIKPLLLKRFPNSTPEQLKEAHSYAYGGCVIQDMGYYPFGSKLFSDLLHYVRTGDFVEALIRDSQNLDEYAFALGALAHYASDNNGHPVAVNRAVPLTYPKLERKYGHEVTYEENPAAHLKTEFGFDVLQVATGRYASDDYRDRIGFQVSKDLLARAFQETYGIPLKSIFTNYDLAVGTYRHSVSSVIPSMTKAAWQLKKDDIQKEEPGITKQRFLFHLSHSSYRKYWHEKYEKPGIGSRILAFLIRLLPKVGPFRALAFRMPTPATEKLFMASFNDSLTHYEGFLHEEKETGEVTLVNDNLDTGTVTPPGKYALADQAYATLLEKLAKNHFAQVSPELRKNILDYYSDPNAPIAMRWKKKKQWAKVVQEVAALQTYDPSAAPQPKTSASAPATSQPQ
ncbi:MAG: zinc dependent phospholipase C family protein [Candidatus Acidiferrales bacterium]